MIVLGPPFYFSFTAGEGYGWFIGGWIKEPL